ncbi:hypothetical protein BvCmsNSP001_04932 [Escherichia coli]|nr:hypothetical protein BvCmsNSP001_04932 [Escherichia coli]
MIHLSWPPGLSLPLHVPEWNRLVLHTGRLSRQREVNSFHRVTVIPTITTLKIFFPVFVVK